MSGIVKMLNSKRGMAAIETNSGYTVFEILGDYDVEIGDEISGDLDSHGGETFKNISKEEHIEVYVEAIQATEQNARQLIS